MKRALLVLGSTVALFGGGCVALKVGEGIESYAEGANAAIALAATLGLI